VGGQANQPGSTRTLSPFLHVGRRWARRHRHMGQIVKLCGNPEGQWYCSGMATCHEHHFVAWGDNPLVIGCHAAELSKLLGILGGYPSGWVPALFTLYTGDIVAAPSYPIVVQWESGSSGRFRD
jgi:hypothetical protein